MAKDNSNSFNDNSSLLKEPGSNKSFVRKVSSRVSGLLPSSLSKWFGNDDNKQAAVRQREEGDDDEVYEIQPPTKRVKIPSSPNTNLSNINNVQNFDRILTNPLHNTTSISENYNYRNTFLEPTPGTSGIKRKLILPNTNVPVRYNSTESLVNGDKDSDSGESTSGYSSMARISHKDIPTSGELNVKVSKPHSNLFNSSTYGSHGHSRSLFTERSISPQMTSSLSSRHPSFNASTFGSPTFVDRTLSTKRIINSPFYNGRTTYGGASAYSNHRTRGVSDFRASLRSQVNIKPVSQSDSDGAALSKTARRILDTLEQYASPVSDAKKIPNPSLKRPRLSGLLTQYTGVNPYLMREHKASVPSNKELNVPSVPDLLKMKLKERLQDSTVSVRQIATSSKSALNVEEYKIRTTEDEQTSKHSNKMKNKVASMRHKQDFCPPEEVKLPDIALPITTLPTFDFPLPVLSSVPISTPVVVKETKAEKPVSSKLITDSLEFKFSNPLVLAENLISIIAINNFKFSEPVNKQESSNSSLVNYHKSADLNNPNVSCNFKASDSTTVTLKRINPTKTPVKSELIKGSIDDVFKNNQSDSNLFDKFKPKVGSWECSDCMVRNEPEHLKCLACEKPKTTDTETNFGDKFKISTNKWECSECFVRNDLSVNSCISCTSPKPGTKPNGPINAPLIPNTFGDKFKPAPNTWECKTCLIRNGNQLVNCSSCQTSKETDAVPKPTGVEGFGDVFKKKVEEWKCDECWICNSSEKTSCSSCLSPRPGFTAPKQITPTKPETNAPPFRFGIFSNTEPSPQESKVDSTQNDEKVDISSVFGQNAKTATTITAALPFTFGAPLAPKVNTTDTPASTGIGNVPIPAPKEEAPKEEVSLNPVEKLPEKITPSAQTGYIFNPPTVSFNPPTTTITTNNNEVPYLVATINKPESKPAEALSNSFTFGNVAQPIKQTETITKFKAPQVIKPPEAPKAIPTIPAFSFGNSTTSLKRPAQVGESSLNAKKEAPSTTSTALMFTPPKQLSKPNSTASNKLDKPMFGHTISPAPPTVPNNLFAPAQPIMPPVSNSNLFTFGAKTTSAPVFGNITTTTDFKFGAAQPNNQPLPTFTPNLPQQQIQQPNNVFGGNSVFGAATSSKPMFEQPTMTTAVAPTPTPLAPSTFGSSGYPSFPFSFTPTAKLAEPTKMPSFNFGGTPAPAPTINPPPSGFSFVQSPPAPPSNIFGAPNQMHMQQQKLPQMASTPAQNGGFNFGAPPNATVKTGFNFGGAPTPQFNMAPQHPPTGSINFGATNQNPAQPMPGGFSFGPPAPPAFNANIKPTFNFTGGATPTFSAQPSVDSAAMAQRKKIRAVRRAQR